MNGTELQSGCRVLPSRANLRLILAGVALLAFGVCGARSQGVVYVCRAAAGANDGTSWTDAFTNLAEALDATGTGTNIWVAEGTYHPGADRSDSFCLKTNVSVYGGFTTQMVEFSERDWTNHVTVLSGDIQQDGIRTNNSYHILTGTNAATLDGFTVACGYADGTGPFNCGGGMHNVGGIVPCSPTIANCIFVSNWASYCGGGIYSTNRCPLTIVNCAFLTNSAQYGGGVYFRSFYERRCAPIVSNCLFAGNTASTRGGGMYLENCIAPNMSGCTFAGNISAGYAGAICANGNCFQFDSPKPMVNCVFTRNSGSYGGVFWGYASPPIITNCLFVGNTATTRGGVIFTTQCRPLIVNCLMIGNYGLGGGVFGGYDGWSVNIKNCTMCGNAARDFGGVAHSYYNGWGNNMAMTNCILWSNAAPAGYAIYNAKWCTNALGYCDIEGGWDGPGVVNNDGSVTFDGGGNIDKDPLFPAPVEGAWSADGVYQWNSAQTALTDTGAAWTPGEHAGKTLKIGTNITQFAVATNSADTITVWGDASEWGVGGGAYAVYDWHLISRGGRWTTTGWTKDFRHSPCIDAGDPNSPYDNEPDPNGGRINIGAYGNTTEASKKLPNGTIVGSR